MIQLPSASSDLLMFAPSYILRPPLTYVSLEFWARSDPAKSTIYSFALNWFVVTLKINMAWERDDVLLALVAATVLLELP